MYNIIYIIISHHHNHLSGNVKILLTIIMAMKFLLPYILLAEIIMKLQSFSKALSTLFTCVLILVCTHKGFVMHMITYRVYILIVLGNSIF